MQIEKTKSETKICMYAGSYMSGTGLEAGCPLWETKRPLRVSRLPVTEVKRRREETGEGSMKHGRKRKRQAAVPLLLTDDCTVLRPRCIGTPSLQAKGNRRLQLPLSVIVIAHILSGPDFRWRLSHDVW